MKDIGKNLMKFASNDGGCYLDHYDGYLINSYQAMGFVEYDRNNYDKEISFRKKIRRRRRNIYKTSKLQLI